MKTFFFLLRKAVLFSFTTMVVALVTSVTSTTSVAWANPETKHGGLGRGSDADDGRPEKIGKIDLSLWGDYRSYPLSGVAEAVVGFDQLLWGDHKTPWYGFARIYGEFDAITQYQGVTLKAELFPVSILGVRVGEGWSQNHQALTDFDCTKDLCTGFFSQKFIEGALFLGAGPVKFAGTYRYTSLSFDRGPSGFTNYIDPDSGLEFSTASSDQQWRARGALFYQLTPHFRLGYSLTEWLSGSTDETSRLWMGFGQALVGPLNIIVGGGEYYSTFKLNNPTVVAIGQWTFWPRLGY